MAKYVFLECTECGERYRRKTKELLSLGDEVSERCNACGNSTKQVVVGRRTDSRTALKHLPECNEVSVKVLHSKCGRCGREWVGDHAATVKDGTVTVGEPKRSKVCVYCKSPFWYKPRVKTQVVRA